MSNSPKSHNARDFLSTPHLSLSLAGIFRDAAAAEEVGDREERSGGGRKEETLEISSENSGPGNDDFEMAGGEQQQHIEEDESKEKKRKKYHRHAPSQIRELEALFKESPHPDEKQRLHLSKHLGLHPRQVKFWFQNRRT
ncbi:homeobox-leucine zipper protein GLABRA 2-like [Primulina tabacum]|uniref:homeobox-leucine zipper protein GLABRA 2-like n=1 Tax=Primulina tabacum TaxID=48773 RepID=UPI003F5A0D78